VGDKTIFHFLILEILGNVCHTHTFTQRMKRNGGESEKGENKAFSMWIQCKPEVIVILCFIEIESKGHESTACERAFMWN